MLHSSLCRITRAISASIATGAYPGMFPRALCLFIASTSNTRRVYPYSADRVMAPTLGGHLFMAGTWQGAGLQNMHLVFAVCTPPTKRGRQNIPSLMGVRFNQRRGLYPENTDTKHSTCRLTYFTFDIRRGFSPLHERANLCPALSYAGIDCRPAGGYAGVRISAGVFTVVHMAIS